MGVNTRYEMPACRYHRQAIVSEGQKHNLENQHGYQGLVRIHNPQQDRFRRFITIGEPEGFVSSDQKTQTFNRGSLIHYLNAELEYFRDKPFLRESNPLPRRLHVGWFEGLIRGSNDERIREACRAVFARYQTFEDRTQVDHRIDGSYLVLAELSFLKPNPNFVKLHSGEYLDGTVRISLSAPINSAQEFHFCMTHGRHFRNLNIHICLQHPNVDTSSVMQTISEIAFLGTAAEDFRVDKICLDLVSSEEPWSELERSLILLTKMREIFEWQQAQGANIPEIIADRQRIAEVMRNAEGYGAIENAYLVEDEALDLVFFESENRGFVDWFRMSDEEGEGIADVMVYNVENSLEAASMFPGPRNGNFYFRIAILNRHGVVNEEAQRITLGEVLARLKCWVADKSEHSGEVIDVGFIRILIGRGVIFDKNEHKAKELIFQQIFNEKDWVLFSR